MSFVLSTRSRGQIRYYSGSSRRKRKRGAVISWSPCYYWLIGVKVVGKWRNLDFGEDYGTLFILVKSLDLVL